MKVAINDILILAILLSCWSCKTQQFEAAALKKWTPGTITFYENLKYISQEAILTGHEDALAYGTDWWGHPDHSDIKALTGQHPAVFGWDLGHILEDRNIDSVAFKDMHQYIKQVYKNGGVNTISWHLKNPVNMESSWDTTAAVAHILPNGKAHPIYLNQLDHLASFLKKCRYKGKPIPIIFRPFHEHNGNWFWWGAHLCSEEEYIKLWRFTIDYLRKEKKLRNIIIAFSPDRSKMKDSGSREEYLYAYPGDEYVDIIGLDNYWDVGRSNNITSPDTQALHYQRSLELIVSLAEEKDKVAALTETGLEGIPHQKWFTQHILNPLKASEHAHKIAYILFWRNFNKEHHYIPYPGHIAQDDFLEFVNDELIFLNKDLPNLYRKIINE